MSLLAQEVIYANASARCWLDLGGLQASCNSMSCVNARVTLYGDLGAFTVIIDISQSTL